MYGKTFIEKVRYTVIFENIYQFINIQVKSKGDIDMTLEEVMADGELQDKMSKQKYKEITVRVWGSCASSACRCSSLWASSACRSISL